MPYTIGIDYGTESGRVVLLDIRANREVSSVAVPYRNGVISTLLPGTQERLPPDWALQDPADYVSVLTEGVPQVLKMSGVAGEDVIGIGVDFTSCTVLPVAKDGVPLCMIAEWENRPHAWPKLWKHHAAQRIADRMNRVAEKTGMSFLSRYGGKVSSEWYFPKLIQIFEEDREVYDNTYAFVEATDWIVWYLTGKECRNSCTAGYKALWSPHDGLPAPEYFAAVNPDFESPSDKLGSKFYPLGTKAGTLVPAIANTLGLSSQCAVAVGNVDAMVSVPSVGVQGPGTMVMVMGTSICHLTVSQSETRVQGITGVVKDGVLPGLYGYEAGQAAVGDMFAWFTKHFVTTEYIEKAKAQRITVYELLEELASTFKPGETGLLALDWWNGNRSILADADLTGVTIGFTLATRPEEIYRALLESTAFGTRKIIDNFRAVGIHIEQLVACGGLSFRSPLLMQIYADVCGLPVTVFQSEEIPARGSAMFGAVAAGEGAGGYASIFQAIDKLTCKVLKVYEPNFESKVIYDEVYGVYQEIHDFFGRRENNVLHRLKTLRMNTI